MEEFRMRRAAQLLPRAKDVCLLPRRRDALLFCDQWLFFGGTAFAALAAVTEIKGL